MDLSSGFRQCITTKLSLLSLSMTLIASAPSINADTLTEPLSLNEFVADSVSVHPRVLEQMHIYRQAEQDLAASKSGWKPRVDLTASTTRVEGDSPNIVSSQNDDYTSQRGELALTQNLFNGFETTYRIKQNKARVKAALFELYDTADNIALDAAQAYLDVLQQRRLLILAQENVRSHEDTLGKITRRSESGAGRRSQLEQTEGRVARARASLVAQQNNLLDALSQAHEILGRYITAEQLIEPEMPPPVDKELQALLDSALLQHPAMQLAKFNIEAATMDRRRGDSPRYPSLDLRLAHEIGDDLNGIPGDTRDTSVSLNLRYNFYNGGADQADRRRLSSVVHEEQQFAHRVRRQVLNTLQLAYNADDSLTRQLVFLQDHVTQTQRTNISYQEEFFIGQRDLLDLLDAKSELNAAQNRYAEAFYAAVAARYRIYEGLGQMFQAINMDVSVDDDHFKLITTQRNWQASGIDELPLDWDRDQDKEPEQTDHCDNTLLGDVVNRVGCAETSGLPDLSQTSSKLASRLVANDDRFDLNYNGVITITAEMLLVNDYSEGGGQMPQAIAQFGQPGAGLLASDAQGNMVYRAREGFIGTDTFTYTIKDGDRSAQATVTLVIPIEKNIDFNRIYYLNFLFDQVALTEESRSRLVHLVRSLNAQPNVFLSIQAYTDSLGAENYNQALSQRRAERTRTLLLEAGIDRSRIVRTIGLGEADPIADNTSVYGQAINRRGEIRFRR